mgnify:FL=1
MGLDAYLMAERREANVNVALDSRPTEAVGHIPAKDGSYIPSNRDWPIDMVFLEIQYWRKHWDLHELINQSYASPDEYNENPMKVYLSSDNLREIAAKIRDDLTEDADPRYRHHTEREEYAKKFDLAADWIEFDGWNRSVYYRGDF